ncbi:MAG TPA: heme exporter protein CcmD [Caulobacteraceae bacterium]|jgi:heme exporter protein D|nr:heme exporter protein CcmD [Caulobacteraceae bacterium]
MPDFHTGRYAAFIWPAYGLTALVLGWMVAETLVRARRWKARAAKKPEDRS